MSSIQFQVTLIRVSSRLDASLLVISNTIPILAILNLTSIVIVVLSKNLSGNTSRIFFSKIYPKTTLFGRSIYVKILPKTFVKFHTQVSETQKFYPEILNCLKSSKVSLKMFPSVFFILKFPQEFCQEILLRFQNFYLRNWNSTRIKNLCISVANYPVIFLATYLKIIGSFQMIPFKKIFFFYIFTFLLKTYSARFHEISLLRLILSKLCFQKIS